MREAEEVKFFLAQQMQSYAPVVLKALLDKRKSSVTTEWPSDACQDDLIRVSSSAIKNEQWAVKGKFRTDRAGVDEV